MESLRRTQDNTTQLPQIERALSVFLSENVFHNAISIIMKINAAIAAFGILANVFNVVVFVKQGFKDTVNISLTSLALSDLASLVFLAWMCLCKDSSFNEYVRFLFDSIDVAYLTGGIPRTYFTHVGSWITSLVSMERCISVIRPLHVKFLFTKRRLIFINVFIFITVSGPYLPLFYDSRLTVKLHPLSNRTYVGLTFTEHWQTINFLFSLLGVAMSVCTFVIVCTSAVVIIIVLARQNKWRVHMIHQAHGNALSSTANNGTKTNEHKNTNTQIGDEHDDESQPSNSKDKSRPTKTKMMTGKTYGDNRATKTVILIAIIFIICYLPSTINKLVMTFVPDFSRAGRYSNMFQFFWSVSFVAEAICSSVNVFVYVGTNTKFKETIGNVIGWCCTLQTPGAST